MNRVTLEHKNDADIPDNMRADHGVHESLDEKRRHCCRNRKLQPPTFRFQLSTIFRPDRRKTLHRDVSMTPLEIKTDELYTCVFSPDGKRALTGASNNAVTLWDTETGKCVHTFDDSTTNAWC